MKKDTGTGEVRYADEFCGIGAMRLGFDLACRDAGLVPTCVHACEIDGRAAEVYRRHFHDPFDPLGDITKIGDPGREIPECDVLLAGFCCQDFSSAGRRKGLDGERGKLFFSLTKVIGGILPKAFLLENVKGLVSHDGGRTLRTVLETLEGLGYSVRHAVLNSRDFGVPQNRPRIYIVGFRDGGDGFRFPEPTDSNKRLKDVLEKNPVDLRHYLSEQYLEAIRRHKKEQEAKGNGFGYEILEPAEDVSNTLVCGGMGRERNLIVDARITEFPVLPRRRSPLSRECVRRLTPVEWERLQGLPDRFTDGQADCHRYRQLGNAVSVPVIAAVAKALLGELRPGGAGGARTFHSTKIGAAPRQESSALTENRAVRPFRVLDLFAGCGALSTGILRTGAFKIVAACEIDPAAAETYRLNHPGTLMVEGDIALEETKRRICEAFASEPCHVVVGGPPCTPFSTSGKRDPNDPRATLFKHYIDVVSRLFPLPSVLVMENVTGILTAKLSDGVPVMRRIAEGLGALGYSLGYARLNAADFGDPQTRKRVIIVAWRTGSFPRFAPTHDGKGRNGLPRWRTVRDAIGDLEGVPEDPAVRHVFTRSGPAVLGRIRLTPPGGHVGVGYTRPNYRCPPDAPALTVKAHCSGVFVHYSRDRLMSPRELARLQGFPDSFRFAGTKEDVLLMIGNAVPVGLGAAVGAAVLGSLRPVTPARDHADQSVPASVQGGNHAPRQTRRQS